ncbi:MAG TPA: type II secretion system F family protein [Syntrophales bacterium]|jgi:tight adherence protein B|nr:type II secretion system F family protein [Syntrophales bacterium]HPX57066.1 type II secretion system F family protein [Syntrophales bacterium]HQA83388.1 type II secretion system F family protein [Syntrophales bacterium]
MQILPAVLIFLAVVLLIESLFLLGRTRWNPEKRRIRAQLRQLSGEPYGSRDIDVVRRRIMSEIPWLNRFLLRVRVPVVTRLERMVVQANLPHPLGFYLLLSGLLFAVGVLLSSIAVRWFWLRLVIGIMLGLLPILYIHLKKRNRIAKFEEQLPEVLDMLARSLKAGHAFTGGMQMISQEFEEPAGTEFGKTLDEINFGVAYEDALKNLVARVDSDDLKLFVISVVIQRESGGNLAEILENIARLIRSRFVLKGQIKTLTAEARLSAIILAGLPFFVGLLIFFTNPDYVKMLFADPIGHVMLAGAGIMMVLGIIVMKRMIQVKV